MKSVIVTFFACAFVAATFTLASPSTFDSPIARLDPRQTTSTNTTKCTYTGSFVTVSPENIVIDDANPTTPFQVKLSKQPLNEVNIFLALKGAKLSTNKITFTPSNWNISQNVDIAANPDFDANNSANSIFITAAFDGPCDQPHRCEQKLQLSRKKKPGKTCMTYGDPHILNFDSVKYDCQDVGPMYLVKSDDLNIQTYQFPCVVDGRMYSCNGAIAIKFKKSAAILTITDKNNTTPDWKKWVNPSFQVMPS
jgi:hypothetical protein